MNTENTGKPLRAGNYDGRKDGYDYRASGCCGTWNLYRNNKFVKHVGLNWMKPIKVYSRDRLQVGTCTGSAYRCRLESCKGDRIGVRWADGRITFPCTEGMIHYKNGDMRIR